MIKWPQRKFRSSNRVQLFAAAALCFLSACDLSMGGFTKSDLLSNSTATSAPTVFSFANGTSTKVANSLSTIKMAGTCVGDQAVSVSGDDGSHASVPCTNSAWSWTSNVTNSEGPINYQFEQTQVNGSATLSANWYRRSSGVLQFFENDPSTKSDDVVYLTNSSNILKIQDPFETGNSVTTTLLAEASTIDNLLATTDGKHVYYAMNGLLHCYATTAANESSDCLHRSADVTALAALNGQNHGPLGPLPNSAISSISSTDIMSWNSNQILNLARGQQSYQYNIPQVTATTRAMTYGVNLHANLDYGNATATAVDQQFTLMASAGLTGARVGGSPTVGANGALNTALITSSQNWLTSAKAHGIKLIFNLDVGWTTCPTDARTFPSGSSLATLYSQSYNGTYNFVSALATYKDFDPSSIQWELGNEIDLIGGQYAGASTSGVPWGWNSGWTAASWQGQSVGGTQVSPNMTNYYEKWNAVLAGAADAIAAINAQNGTAMPRIINVVWTHMGFISFMQNPGSNGYGPVNFEKISYHYYQSLGTSAYSLAASAPNSGVNNWNLFAGLAQFNKPILFDEFNCGEIYNGNVSGSAANSTGAAYATCLSNLRTQIGYVKNNTQINIEGIYAYELLDEPTNASGVESEFGLFWNNNGVYTPKANFYLWSAFSGANLNSSAQSTLNSFGLLPLP